MLLGLLVAFAAALRAPPSSPPFTSCRSFSPPFTSRRSVLLAAPLAAVASSTGGKRAAHALGPPDILFGWIPDVGCSVAAGNLGDKSCSAANADEKSAAAPEELSMGEKIRRRRKQLAEEEEAKLMEEYRKNRGNSAASSATDAAGRR